MEKPNFKSRHFVSTVHAFNRSATPSSGKIIIEIMRKRNILVMILFFIHHPHGTHTLKWSVPAQLEPEHLVLVKFEPYGYWSYCASLLG